MPINYVLFENNLTSDPTDYMAMVQPTGTAELEDVIERIIQQGSTVTRPDIVSVMEDFFQRHREHGAGGDERQHPLGQL